MIKKYLSYLVLSGLVFFSYPTLPISDYFQEEIDQILNPLTQEDRESVMYNFCNLQQTALNYRICALTNDIEHCQNAEFYKDIFLREKNETLKHATNRLQEIFEGNKWEILEGFLEHGFNPQEGAKLMIPLGEYGQACIYFVDHNFNELFSEKKLKKIKKRRKK